MHAGPELDLLIAKKFSIGRANYSTEMTAAWLLICFIETAGFAWDLLFDGSTYLFSIIDSNNYGYMKEGETAPQAICLAALKLPSDCFESINEKT